MKRFKAIAAISLNRVMGREGGIPWHLPEDFRWFKRTTLGHVLVMGRKTFESIGRPLPGRETIVLSRSGFEAPGVRVVAGLDAVDPAADSREYFICGGAQVYQQALPRCSDLFLTVVRRQVDGDVFFPAFEAWFERVGILLERPEFEVQHWRNRDRQE